MQVLRAGLVMMLVGQTVHAQKNDSVVAVVNGEAIPRIEFEAAYQQRAPVLKRVSAEQSDQLKQAVINGLVDDALFRQFLKKNAPPVDPREVEKQLKALETSLAKHKRTVTEYCLEMRLTPEQVKNNLAQMIQWTTYAASKLKEADVRKYYEENKPLFDKATVRASHIVIRLPANAPGADRATAHKKLEDLRAEIAAGKISFLDAAAKHSQCPSSSRGGDLGYIYRKWMVDEAFAKAAFALEVGVLSDVVDSEIGCHLIQVTERRAGVPSFYNDPRVQDAARECLLEEMRQKLLADLRAQAKIEIFES
jgi:peptidyl-prolyl cis-trans isomerase C